NAAIDDQRAKEPPKRTRDEPAGVDPVALQGLDGGDIGEPVDGLEVLRNVCVGEVKQAPREPASPSFDQHLLVRVHASPPGLLAAEKTEPVIRIPTTTVPPAPQIVNESRDVEAVDAGRAIGELLLNFGSKLRRHALVGVEIQHPFQPRLLERKLLLLAISRPISDEHAARELSYNIECAISGV